MTRRPPRDAVTSKSRKPREYVPPTTLAIGPRWIVKIEPNYNPACPPSLRLTLGADDGRNPLVLFLRGDETRRLIEALEAAERTL
jgi:hypothetical protein